MHILGIAGSLRRGSFNRALLRAAIELAPPGITITPFEGLREVPPYDADIDVGDGPAPVRALREAIRAADALLICTPEYNYGPPGVLKNAIDWASRPFPDSVLRYKRIGLMGASGGMAGTARAQLALRQSFVLTQSWVLTGPEVLVSFARDRFDDAGRLTDEKTRGVVAGYLERLGEEARREPRVSRWLEPLAVSNRGLCVAAVHSRLAAHGSSQRLTARG